MKAVVLAAGEGRRLRPLTETRPKVMLPVANKPLLEHVVEALVEAGVDEIVLVVGYRRERIQNHFGDGAQWDVDIEYVVQEQQLGTGHALLQAASNVGGEFIALNGDRIIDAELVERVWERRRETGHMAMAITEAEEPSNYGVVEVSGREVVGIQEQPLPPLAKSNMINAGVYAFGPGIFAALRETERHGEQGLTTTLASLLDDHTVEAVPHRGLWLDVSHPWDLIEVNDAVIEYGEYASSAASVDDTAVVSDVSVLGEGTIVHPQATILRGSTLGDHVSVGPHVILENTIILSDVTIKGGAVLKDCIVGANTVIGPNSTVEGGDADVVIDDEVYRDVRFGGIVGDNAEFGGNVVVRPGAVIGNETTVDSGSVVSGRIESGTHVTRG
ncbi:sugar phosphate nucleotidyltransferase [Halarchaeum sp. P4]|uniref:sugar phosphate nucleotidyltransferase n=1 Tax=Halarchaeum sp. P4 TaxID=3421639 RepID=UPI003EB97446